MTWYINRGEDLVREQTIRFPFFQSLPAHYNNLDLVFHTRLRQSECKAASEHLSPGTTRSNCNLPADLRGADLSKFKKRIGTNGLTYFDVHYDLAVTIAPAVMKFSLEMDGKEMGTVNANYD